jgi:GT2 family glycosyltransferase
LDGTADMIRKEFPYVKLVENDRNLGFAKGNNVGIRLAAGKYIFLSLRERGRIVQL